MFRKRDLFKLIELQKSRRDKLFLKIPVIILSVLVITAISVSLSQKKDLLF